MAKGLSSQQRDLLLAVGNTPTRSVVNWQYLGRYSLPDGREYLVTEGTPGTIRSLYRRGLLEHVEAFDLVPLACRLTREGERVYGGLVESS